MQFARMRSYSVFISTSWCRKVWGRRKWQRHESWGSDSGSCCVTKLITKSSVVADNCDRSTVVPMRECLLANMILHSSDRIPEQATRLPEVRGVRRTHHGLRGPKRCLV